MKKMIPFLTIGMLLLAGCNPTIEIKSVELEENCIKTGGTWLNEEEGCECPNHDNAINKFSPDEFGWCVDVMGVPWKYPR